MRGTISQRILQVGGLVLFLSSETVASTDEAIAQAARILKSEGIVAFPTETVYGLGARFDSEKAIERIFVAKGRPDDNPLIVHISHPDELSVIVTEVPAIAERLILSFWPGPLTIVLPKAPIVPKIATGGLNTVGVRMPAHPMALALIRAVGVPLVAPSANLSGRPSPTSALHVKDDLAGRIDAILDGGDTEVGLESTVVSVAKNRITILRPGSVTREMLEDIGQVHVAANPLDPNHAPAAPGMKYVHYAPRAQVSLFVGQAIKKLPEFAHRLQQQGAAIAVVAFEDTLMQINTEIIKMPLGQRGRVDMAAKRLYAYLREADHLSVDYILVEGIEAKGLGEALMNRLTKAATHVFGG
ncbi:MAG: L-threonylcarbamoyladenylate synthase [Bacillota bacterium]|nr:L-threonylcarbamoyladenylate synthase [Bacillota bacterium]